MFYCSPAPFFASQKIAPRGFEPLNENQQQQPQHQASKALTENRLATKNPVLDTSLDKILQKDPDLTTLVERWPDLPAEKKQAILKILE